ncbi:MAG: hypothetical protein GWO20_02290 [Candidatus Korarchaeota archaeon]|nr:hypothetical protein [Candidatus Korarchaeota archaeon]
MTGEDLRRILALIVGLLINPLLPSFGLQAMLSIAIGMMMPQRVVEPVNDILHKVPVISNVVSRFENNLVKRKRLRTTIPRVLAGYFSRPYLAE